MFYNKTGGLQSIGYTPDGRILALDNRARLSSWDIQSAKPHRITTAPEDPAWAVLKGCRSHSGWVTIITPSPSCFRCINLNTGTERTSFVPGDGYVVDMSEDGRLILIGNRIVPIGDDALYWQLWDVEQGQPLPGRFELPGRIWGELRCTPHLAPDASAFAMTIVHDQRLLLWRRGHSAPVRLPRPGRGQNRHGKHYSLLCFSAEGRFLVGAQAAPDGFVTTWDVADGSVRWSLLQKAVVWALAVHPSGRIVAVATEGRRKDRAVRFLDAATGAEITRYDWNAGRIRSLAFSPDGLTCAAGCTDRRLVVWDVDG